MLLHFFIFAVIEVGREQPGGEMIQGHDIICFSNDWDADPLSKKHIMQRLATHNRILWVNSIGMRNPTASARDFKRIAKKFWDFAHGCRRLGENLYLFSPLAIPLHGNAAARWFNRFWLALQVRLVCQQIGFRNAITWTFVPYSADVVGNLGEKHVIYHCVDEFSEFTGTDKAAILDMERRLIDKSDAVIVSSGRLQQAKGAQGAQAFLVTHGVDVAHFRKACNPHTAIPADIAGIPAPIIGFFGLIEDWVDLRLMRFLAQARPQWSFVLIGKVATDDSPLRGLLNVHLLGRKEYQQLPAYCKAFDVGLLPFVINELTLAANPLKLREYLAAGLPVVASAIPEAERLEGLLRIARTDEEFLEQIGDLLAGGLPPEARLSISQSMENETWDRKVEDLSRIVESLGARSRRLAWPSFAPVRRREF
jgi:glycosyltransferase involved in cell wall biosynthesis